MKVVLAALNSKYIHSNLAIRYLKAYTESICEVSLAEFTINQRPAEIAAEIIRLKPSLLGFSTYIWNYDEILHICSIIKTVAPNITIILGGPEVSYDPENVLKENECIDLVIFGEGEETFRELLAGIPLIEITGLAFRSENEIVINEPRALIKDLDCIPFPYSDGEELKNKIVYYEASRGCPFNCAFCLSSTIRGVRFFPIERVKRDLDLLMKSGAKQVKFVDRTFNANRGFSKAIMEHISDSDPEMTSFHLEITAHLIDDDQLAFFKDLREDLFQFEIGVQSTNTDTIKSIGRDTDFERLKYVTKAIASYGNIHQHLDLIAGLPHEGYKRFGVSFNDLYEIKPEKIQLGFLKLLKGSKLRIDAGDYGYKFLDRTPYEVLANKFISYEEIIKLKDIEELVEKYYNENQFKYSLRHVVAKNYQGAFEFFEDFSSYWRSKNFYKYAQGKDSLYRIFIEFYKSRKYEDLILFEELLKLDYIVSIKGGGFAPFFGRGNQIDSSRVHALLKTTKLIEDCLPDEGDTPVKELLKKVRIELFETRVIDSINTEPPYQKIDEQSIVLFYRPDSKKLRTSTMDITKYYLEDEN